MAENSKIEWCDHTFNPWFGCTKVSPACKHCYAESLTKRTGLVVWGPQAERRVSSEANWKLPLKWERDARDNGGNPKVFCASLADVFEDRSEIVEARKRLWDLIDRTQCLRWLLLTKRPENISGMLPEYWGNGWANVWLGTTVEDQQRVDERIPHLLRTPAAKRFLSVEPMLGAVDLLVPLSIGCGESGCTQCRGIDWVICGGESGRNARPMHPDWARSLLDQCKAAGVAFFMKQLSSADTRAYKDFEGFPQDLQIREFPPCS
jgi:protein gp37